MEFCTTTKKEISENIDFLLNETKSFKFENWNKENFLMNLPLKWKLSIVAKKHGKIIGFSFNSKKEQAMHLHYFYVFKNYRNRKSGQLLLQKCTEQAHKYNFKMVTLKCNIYNYRALKFYKKNDFVISCLDGEFYLLFKNVEHQSPITSHQ